MKSTRLAPALLACLLAVPGLAVDGVTEINQVCADQTGCTPGDAPGFPVELESGSYRLTGDVSNPDPGTNVIQIEGDVDLDLNGFAVSGGRDGITNLQGEFSFGSLRVHDGSVEDVGLVGVRISGESVVENVSVRDSGDTGIFVGVGSRAVDCLVSRNAGGGIGAFGSAVISGNVVRDNAVAGIAITSVAAGGTVIRDNLLHDNPDLGISAPVPALLSGNLVTGSSVGIEAGDAVSMRGDRISGSTQDGVTCGEGCNLVGVSSSGNGGSGIVSLAGSNVVDCVTRDNGNDGVRVGDGSRVSGCATAGNGDDGIQASGASGVNLFGNTSFGNVFGLFLNAETAFGQNTVSGSTTSDVFGATGVPSACNVIAGVAACP